MPDRCHGNGPDHCCWFAGMVCPFVEEHAIPGRRWACGLRRTHGAPVERLAVWQARVRPLGDAAGMPPGWGCTSYLADLAAGGYPQCCYAEGG